MPALLSSPYPPALLWGNQTTSILVYDGSKNHVSGSDKYSKKKAHTNPKLEMAMNQFAILYENRI